MKNVIFFMSILWQNSDFDSQVTYKHTATQFWACSRHTQYRLHQITCLRIPGLYSPSQSSTLKCTPCGFISTVSCCQRLLFAFHLRRSNTQTFMQLFVTEWSNKIFGISHSSFSLCFFFLWPSNPSPITTYFFVKLEQPETECLKHKLIWSQAR